MKRHIPLGIALGAALFLRWAWIGYGLPRVFNSDEPHIVNLAVSFGRGSLNPYSFKYPTLWPTVLFFCYGLYFLAWSRLGLRHRLGDFAAHFAWDPSAFYLIARTLSAVCTILAVLAVWKMERENRDGEKSALPWGALLLAFSPALVESAHAAKPDSAMLLLAACAWLFALRLYRTGERRWHWLCGACLGLAFSCQYTMVAGFVLLPAAHWTSPKKKPLRWLLEGAACAAGAFLIGSPYVLLDFPKFWSNVRDFSYLAHIPEREAWLTFAVVLTNFWTFAGEGGIAGLALLAGLFWEIKRERRRAGLWLAPFIAYLLFLGTHPDGGWRRYLFGCYPGLAFLAGEGLSHFLSRRGRAWTGVAALLALGPGLWLSWRFDRELSLPDTRLLAEDWINHNLPAGAALLLDEPHASPDLVMDKSEVAELAETTARIGSPRSRLYAAMRDAHPGGGYRVYRVRRSAADLRSNPQHVALSQADTPVLDVRPGLDAVRAMRVDYVVTSSFGANPERARELATFFEELCAQGELVKEFVPARGALAGPLLRIYRLVSYTKRSR